MEKDAADILECMDMGIVRLDAGLKVTFHNRQAADLLGRPGEDLSGQALGELFSGPFRERLEQETARSVRKGTPARFEQCLPTPEGLWLSCRIRPFRDGAIVTCSDITESKRMEQAASQVQERKELLQTIIDTIPVMIGLLDPSGRVKLVNREFERVTGWTLEEARSMDILSATQPDPVERQRVVEAVMKAEPGWLDFSMVTRSGRTLSTSWANVRFPDGSVMGIGVDISFRRKMEQDLLRLGTAVQQSKDGIALSSPEGVIEYVNQAYERISGYSREELIGRNVRSFTDYFAGYSVQDIIDHIVNEGNTWSGRQQRRRKTGETVEVEFSASPVLDETGRVINIVSMLRDVTQEVRLQRQLAHSQRMEAIGSLAGGIAHDLKNILTPILINTEVALEDVGEESPARLVLEEVLDAARLGRDLVQQILTFSRRAPQKKAPVNVPSVIRETLAFLRSTLPSTIEISSELKDSCAMAYADPIQVKQVLINLGSNAGHAMQETGGTLTVKESREDLDEVAASLVSPDLAPGPYVLIEVQDTGHGMDEETMEHIFEPFFTTKKGEGTGMGLAVAHGIVRDHQGAITVRSRPGMGTTFTILLPELKGGKEQETGCTQSRSA